GGGPHRLGHRRDHRAPDLACYGRPARRRRLTRRPGKRIRGRGVLVRRGLFVLEDEAVRRHPELPESILHQPLLAVWRRPHELAYATVRSKANLHARADFDGGLATHLAGTVPVMRPSSRRRTYSPN